MRTRSKAPRRRTYRDGKIEIRTNDVLFVSDRIIKGTTAASLAIHVAGAIRSMYDELSSKFGGR